MKRQRVSFSRIATLLLASSLSISCSKAPVTGRKQYNIVPDSIMLPLGKSAYQEILADVNTEKGTENHEILKRVGKRISNSANQPDYKWRYSLIKEDTINAWCLPGGKIGFYNGILPVLRNEAGMSFVMGHEVGHATAHHGAERLSQKLTLLGGLAALSLYIDSREEVSDEQRALMIAALGAGATVGYILPFSRKHEKEADVIGLMYMAKAGYPPGESIKVWDRMARQTGGSSVPTFLSTHPSHSQRQSNLKDWMPQARKRYQRNKLARDTQEAIWRRK
jgi:predicted Zn-dependent protease